MAEQAYENNDRYRYSKYEKQNGTHVSVLLGEMLVAVQRLNADVIALRAAECRREACTECSEQQSQE